MTVGKFVVGTLTGSVGILAEVIHSLVDFMDETREGVYTEICAPTKKVECLIMVRNVNVRLLGSSEIFTDLHVILARHLSLEDASVFKRNIVKKMK
jgi:divalent metal cation (Fe/Co/Zn/Cd) transporter